MSGFLHQARQLTAEEAAAYKDQTFPGATEVNQPWASHGPVLDIGGIAYFQGNARDPTDKCGTDSLWMRLLSMQPNGVCPADGLQSYILFPDTGVAP